MAKQRGSSKPPRQGRKKPEGTSSWLAELYEGTNAAVLMDDTGFPGVPHPNEYFHPDRETWVAVIVPPRSFPRIVDDLDFRRGLLGAATGAHEFHFSELVTGRGAFRALSAERRLAFLRMFANLFVSHGLEILFESLDAFRAQKLVEQYRLTDPLLGNPHFSVKRPKDVAFVWLVLRVARRLEELNFGVPAQIYADEWRRWTSAAMTIFQPPMFWHLIRDGCVRFHRSHKVPLLQLADFASFALARNHWIAYKDSRSPTDQEVFVTVQA